MKVKNKLPRTGSDTDRDRLHRLFEQLGFTVERWGDRDSEILADKIELEKKRAEHEKSDAFVMVAMSHGINGRLGLANGETIDINKELVAPFDGMNWPVMAEKPKIFLFQCCRGTGAACQSATPCKKDSTTEDGDSTTEKGDSTTEKGDSHAEGEDSNTEREYAISANSEYHPKANILKIFSTYDEYRARRDPTYGSWFITEFVLVTEAYAHQLHLQEIVLKATNLLACRRGHWEDKPKEQEAHSSSQGEQSGPTRRIQIAETQSSLQKKFYFFPEEKPRTSHEKNQ